MDIQVLLYVLWTTQILSPDSCRTVSIWGNLPNQQTHRQHGDVLSQSSFFAYQDKVDNGKINVISKGHLQKISNLHLHKSSIFQNHAISHDEVKYKVLVLGCECFINQDLYLSDQVQSYIDKSVVLRY